MKLAIGSRFWGTDSNKDFPRIHSFVEASKLLTEHVLVAVNIDEDKIGTVDLIPDVAFAVTPWGKFVQPLNAIVLKALGAKCTHLLLASSEFPPAKNQVEELTKHMDPYTLVVGAAFAEHQFDPGRRVYGTGLTVPWNTFALWNLKHLGRVGFPLLGDAAFKPSDAGVEEVATLRLFQLTDKGLVAKLIKVSGLGDNWNTDGWSEERFKRHEEKIQSKLKRPRAQLDWANWDGSLFVDHID